jgi:hypothetical protein
MFYGLLAGSLLGFGAGCGHAFVENKRMIERMRAEDPNTHVCGLIMFAEIAVGIIWSVPGGLLGAAVGAACKWWSGGSNDRTDAGQLSP